MSQYIATLNQPSPQQDLLADPAPVEDFSDFLNADFFDVSNARHASVDFGNAGNFDINFDNQPSQPLKSPEGFQPATSANMDFNLNGKCVLLLLFTLSFSVAMGWTFVEEGSLQLPYIGLQHAVQWQATETQADPNPAMLCCLHCSPHTMQINQSADGVSMQPCC